MPPVILCLIALYFILLCVLIAVAYSPRLFRHYTLCKGLLSTLFVVIAVICSLRSGTPMFWPVTFAFLSAAAGDVLIGVANNRYGDRASHSLAGLIGVGCFSIAHIFYIVWFYAEVPFLWYQQLILPVIVALAMLKLTKSSSFDFGSRRPAGVFYYAIMAMMFSAGLNLALQGFGISSLKLPMIGIGVTLFMISDLLMLFLYFYTGPRAKSLRFWNLSTYYIGQLLIALAIIA